jgi:phage terminase large subunit
MTSTLPEPLSGPSTRDLTHVYAPRGTALRLLLCRDPEVLVSGPAGTGKSRACLEKVLAVALANPGCRCLVVRKTNTSLTSTTMVTWREHVAKEALEAGLVEFYGGSTAEPPQYRFGNGSSVVIGGLDKPTKIMGSEYDLIYVGESTELLVADWEAITSRLRNYKVSFQQVIADCNPDRPTHWLKLRADEGKTTILHSAHWENPRLYREATDGEPATLSRDGVEYTLTQQGTEYLGRLANLTGVRKARLLDGRWVAAEGLVYDSWDPAVHHLKPFKIHREWPRFWVVDFGFTNPFCCQWWAEDPDGRLIMYREIYRTRRLVEDHARHMLRLVTHGVPAARATDRAGRREQDRLIKDEPAEAVEQGLLRWIEPKPVAIICDHDAEDRATLSKHLRMGTTPARKEVSRGIQAVEKRLRVPEDGRPRLVLFQGALVEVDPELKEQGRPTCTVDEFGSYVWPDGKPGRAEDEHPVKEHDHGMDDVRYLVAHHDLRRKFADRDIFLAG